MGGESIINEVNRGSYGGAANPTHTRFGHAGPASAPSEPANAAQEVQVNDDLL
jgi:hypothetical protein